jgi:SDR family mycofactocin-dependent oxidoreductase
VGRVDGKVALVTGAARGQGRSHALRLAGEGADIIALDICASTGTSIVPASTPEDLADTVAQIEALDRRVVSAQVDVRDYAQLEAEVSTAVAELGRLDIVCANAGSTSYGSVAELSEQEWRDVIDINLTGAWHTCKATVPRLVEQGHGGSIVLTSSALGLKASRNVAHYTAAKHGVVGLMRSMAQELAPHRIRVNTVNPGTVNTKFVHNEPTYRLFAPDVTDPGLDLIRERMTPLNLLPVPWVEPLDISNAVLFLASDEARYITGITLPVDMGTLAK